MTRQTLNRGTTANDGTGDTLRQAALKIEQNFQEIYQKLGGTDSVLMPLLSFDSDGIIFEGTTVNDFEIKLTSADPTADRTVTIPDQTGFVVVDAGTQTLTDKTIVGGLNVSPEFASDSSDSNIYTMVIQEPAANRNINLPLLTDSDEITFNNQSQVLKNKVISSSTLIDPVIGTKILDSSGNAFIEFVDSGSTENYFRITSAPDNKSPTFSAVGDDTNIDLNLSGKGTGGIKLQSKLKLDHETIQADGTVDLNKPLTFFDAGGLMNITVPDGTETGEIKYLVNQNTGAANINSITGYTSITLEQKYTCTLLWDGSEWIALNVSGDSAGAIIS